MDAQTATRPDRHTYYMRVAMVVSTRSTCTRRSVGAVLVKHNHIVGTGYNGAPARLAHCIDGSCLTIPPQPNCLQTVHAELNALLHASSSLEGCTMYSTDQPCLNCLKAALSAGVRHIFYRRPYPSEERDAFIKHNNLDGYLIQSDTLVLLDDEGNPRSTCHLPENF